MNGGKATHRGKRTAALLFAVGGVVAVAVLAMLASVIVATDGSPTAQPIQFNHRLHVEEVEEPCSTCHQFFETRENSGRPTVAVCADCHDEAITESAEEAKLIENFVQNEAELPWRRVTRVPPHVRFSHQRHVKVAELACERCHGKIAELTRPPTRPLVALTMNFCLGCHRALRYRITARSARALKAGGASAELVDDLRLIQGRRFESGPALLAAFEELLTNPLTDPERKLVLSHLDPPQPVTVDCIACHR